MDARIPKVIILVLNWNGWRDTLDCLESLYSNDFPDYQVVLIDNDSQDDSMEKINDWAQGRTIPERDAETAPLNRQPLPYVLYGRLAAEQGGVADVEAMLQRQLPPSVPYPLIVIQSGANLGFAGGNNVGLKYARVRGAKYILLLNNDALLRSRHAITTMVEFMETHPQAGACGGRLFYPDGSLQSSYGNFPTLPRALAFLFPVYKLLPKRLFRNVKRANVVPDASINEPFPVDYPSGACLLVKGAAIEDVGLLDEQFFMYAEETDWCLRMMKSGWDRYYIPQAEVVHKYAGSFTRSKLEMNLYFIDSLFKYYRKNFTCWRLWIVTSGYLVRSLCSILYGTLAACFMRESLRFSSREQIRHWRFSLKLAITTMKDLLAGNSERKHELNHAEIKP